MLEKFLLLLLTAIGGFSEETTKIPSINDLMSIEDQKATGVIHLKQHQKMALAQWIISQKAQETPLAIQQASVPTQTTTLSININSGAKLQMEDGSVWEIHPQDIDTASVWLTTMQLDITPSQDPNYPYILTNPNSQQSVRAKKLP